AGAPKRRAASDGRVPRSRLEALPACDSASSGRRHPRSATRAVLARAPVHGRRPETDSRLAPRPDVQRLDDEDARRRGQRRLGRDLVVPEVRQKRRSLAEVQLRPDPCAAADEPGLEVADERRDDVNPALEEAHRAVVTVDEEVPVAMLRRAYRRPELTDLESQADPALFELGPELADNAKVGIGR